jgi:hypothetical protein
VPLVSCPTCDRKISDQAAACPGYGHPMRQTQYTTVEVIGVGSELRGYNYLQELLSEGWQITHEDYQEDGVDAEGYERSITRYDLRK